MNQKSKGLGDTLEKIFKTTGIQWLIIKTTGFLGLPCGCDYRRDLLNKWFPYKLSKTEKYLKKLKKRKFRKKIDKL